MKRLGLVLAMLALLVSTAACSEDERPTSLPKCAFDVGDTVSRGGMGAVVPPRGQSVSGHADGVSSSSEITIETGADGVVTITGSRDGEPIPRETCILP